MRRVFRLGERKFDTVVHSGGRDLVQVNVDGLTQDVRLIVQDPGRGLLDLSVARLPVRWDARGQERWLLIRGEVLHYRVEESRPAAAGLEREEGEQLLRAPLPGKVIRIAARTGERVERGQLLAVVEAMKVEHRITAPYGGKVGRFYFAEGERCGKDDLLLDLEPSEGS